MSVLNVISEAPDWLLEQAVKKSARTQSISPPSGVMAGEMFSPGRRHRDFVSQAGLLRRNGAPTEFIETILLDMNTKLTDPLPETEIVSIARSMERYEPSHIEGINHKSFSEILLKDLDGKCLYCVGDGFYFYRNLVWERDVESLLVLDSAAELTEKLLAQVEQMKSHTDIDAYQKLKDRVYRSQCTTFLANAIKQYKAKKQIRTSFDDFNKRKGLINFKNCALNTDTFETCPHDPKHKFTWLLDVDYDPKAECPVFDRFLNDILPPSSQRLLLQLIACALTGKKREQVFVFLVGEKQNGKSTFVKVIHDIFSALSANVEPSSLMAKTNNQIPNDLARLAGKRFVFTSETKLGNVIDAPLLKRMTGGDTVTARFMRSEFFEFTPEFIPFIVTNYLPVIDGSDSALKRRMLMIPFDRIIPDDQVDKNIGQKFEAEKSGIVNRVLGALLDYQQNGLIVPGEIKDRINQYVDGSNLIKRFFDECLEADEKETGLMARELHYHYCTWSEGYKVKPLSEPQFKLIFERTTGVIQDYNSRGRFWPGLRWHRKV